MLIKLAALGALGYAGYRYLQKTQAAQGGSARSTGQVALAGGPLSNHASIQSDPDTPPASASAAGDILRTMP